MRVIKVVIARMSEVGDCRFQLLSQSMGEANVVDEFDDRARYRGCSSRNEQWVPGPAEVAQLEYVPIRPAHEQEGGRLQAPTSTEPHASSSSLCCHASLVAIFSALLTIAIPLVISAHGHHAQGVEHDVWRDSCCPVKVADDL